MSLGQWIGKEDAKKILGVDDDRALAAILKGCKLPTMRGAKNAVLYPRGRVLQIARARAVKAAKVEEVKHEVKAKKIGVPRAALPSVENIPTSGQITARAFKLFADQRDLADVAIELEITGEEVEDLFLTWWRLKQRTQEWQQGTKTQSQPVVSVPEPSIAFDPDASTPAVSQPTSAPVGTSAVKCEGEREDGLCCPAHFFRKNQAANG